MVLCNFSDQECGIELDGTYTVLLDNAMFAKQGVLNSADKKMILKGRQRLSAYQAEIIIRME